MTNSARRLRDASAHPVSITALILVALHLPGCQSAPAKSERQQRSEDFVSADQIEQLRSDLLQFSDRFTATVGGAASDIAWNTKDRKIRETSLLWRIRAIPAVRQAVLTDDPRLGLLQSWVLCEQLVDALRDAESEYLGESRQVALDVCAKMLRDIEAIARRHVPEEKYAEANEAVSEFADQYPIRRNFATEMIAPGQDPDSTALLSMLAIPVSGLSESADSIDRLARVAGVFTEVVEDLPLYIRWQAELLLLEVDSLEAVQESQANLQRFATAAESFAQTAESLPTDLRIELDAALAATGPVQDDLRSTVAEVRAAIADVDTAIVKANDTVLRVEEASAALGTTAEAWRSTADAVQGVTADIRALQDRPPDPDPEAERGRPFDITEYEATAREIRDGATEIRGLLEDIESGKLTAALQETDAAARDAIDHAALRVESIVQDASMRLIMIGGALVGVLILGQLLVARSMRRR